VVARQVARLTKASALARVEAEFAQVAAKQQKLDEAKAKRRTAKAEQ
jgi:hypothetical protein